jgi:hypothetical protein
MTSFAAKVAVVTGGARASVGQLPSNSRGGVGDFALTEAQMTRSAEHVAARGAMNVSMDRVTGCSWRRPTGSTRCSWTTSPSSSPG